MATTPGSDAPSTGSKASEVTGVTCMHVGPRASCFITNKEPLRCWLGSKDLDGMGVPFVSAHAVPVPGGVTAAKHSLARSGQASQGTTMLCALQAHMLE